MAACVDGCGHEARCSDAIAIATLMHVHADNLVWYATGAEHVAYDNESV